MRSTITMVASTMIPKSMAPMLSRLSEDDLETLTKALAPLERLAERSSS